MNLPDIDQKSDLWFARRSGGRAHADDARTPAETDYARIVHSSAFRRLQGKTQILALGDDDFYRTRLTHSLEVAQVAAGVIQQLHMRGCAGPGLLPPTELISAIGLAHDLGHPPFGHGGELALNYCMRDHGGFEGNGQTLRIVARLESYVPDHGADLTRRSLLGLLKYPVERSAVIDQSIVPSLHAGMSTVSVIDRDTSKPAKAYYDEDAAIVGWIFEPLSPEDRARFVQSSPRVGAHAKSLYKSFDCSVMDVADDIAYGVHDLEDAIALGLIDEERFRDFLPAGRCAGLLSAIGERPLTDDRSAPYDSLIGSLFGAPAMRKRAIGRLVHHFLRAVDIVEDIEFEHTLLRNRARLPEEPRDLLDALQALVVEDVINGARVQQLEFKGQRMVVAVFEALASDPRRLLPTQVFAMYETVGARAICDYVASMTDSTLLKSYERLFSPRMGSLFDRL
ncbi:anti-phage deoxyguanosine triphosphatase [Sphingomonas sp.]|uniref:anti-phage deoxyguanosine triphosphatase n=1 Tax=Sphingomonas sp. TaxID=28214 RepID=UPI002FDB61DC